VAERTAERPAERAGEAARGARGRLGGAWRGLDRNQRTAGVAAIALIVALVLPWYQQTGIADGRPVDQALSGFGVFGFVEGAILLVAAGVLLLLFARGERRAFHLPGGDGAVILAAGMWVLLLLIWRIFDRPEPTGVQTGIEWGFLFAFAAAVLLAFAGARIRSAHRPEPPLPAAMAGGAPPPGPVATPPATAATPADAHRPTPAATPPAAEDRPTAATDPSTAPTRVHGDERPTRVGRRRAVPPVPDDQLTMPLGSEEPLPREERDQPD